MRDSDLPLWHKAQETLGESISSLFVDYLKDRLELERRKKGRPSEVQAINALLTEINAALNLDMELHPFWRYPILDQNNLKQGFRLHQKRDTSERIMNLVVSPFDFDASGKSNTALKERIKMEIQKFWSAATTKTETFVDTTRP